MANEIKVSCINPCCDSVAYIRENGRGDDYFTCSKCGPYNGKGKAFRKWMEQMRAGVEDQVGGQPVTPVGYIIGEEKTEPEPELENKADADEIESEGEDWFEQL